MGIVTGLTAERMLAIEAASIVDGEIDVDGHLILIKHDGTEIDAGDALVAVPDINLVDILNGDDFTQISPPDSYPEGVSLMHLSSAQATAGAWTNFTSKTGTIKTIKLGATDIAQIWTRHINTPTDPEIWFRGGNSSGWSGWLRLATTSDLLILSNNDVLLDERLDDLETEPGTHVISLTANSLLETAPATDYPQGISILSLTSGSGWSINSGLGVVVTQNYGTDRVSQILYSHADAALTWRRVNHSSIPGWSSWKKSAYFGDEVAAAMGAWTPYTPTWTAATTNPVLNNGTITARYKRIDKIIHFHMLVTMGSTTTYGSGAWRFSLPVVANSLAEGTVFSALASQGSTRAPAQGLYEHANTAIIVSNASNGSLWGATTPFTWANGNIARISGCYEAA